jgi:nucleotide-binding universal stress UspA family protein
MISHILVPTDFSPVANNALHYAIAFAKQTQAHVHVLHVKSFPVMDTSFPTDAYSTLVDELNTISKNGLEKLKSTYLATANIKYTLSDVTGFVNDEIEQYAKSNNIDLIVMGTTGASGLEELLVGSNSATTVSRSEIPVLVVPPTAQFNSFKHILYASDYTEPEFPALSRLLYFAELSDAEISVLHVKTDYDRYFKSGNNFFVRNKEHIKTEKIKLVKSEEDDVFAAINEYIDTHEIDMLVLAKHQRSFFDRIFHRSLSKRMAYHTKVPLLVLHK